MNVERLEALAGVVDEADALGGPTPEQAQQQQEAEDDDAQAREWGMIPYTVGSALAMFVPELRHVYTEDRCLAWGRSVVPVANKYGWNAGGVPELGLLLSTAGLVLPTVFLIRKRLTEEPDAKDSGVWSAVRAWWRDKRAKRAAQVGQQVAEVAGDGSAP